MIPNPAKPTKPKISNPTKPTKPRIPIPLSLCSILNVQYSFIDKNLQLFNLY